MEIERDFQKKMDSSGLPKITPPDHTENVGEEKKEKKEKNDIKNPSGIKPPKKE